MAKGEQAARISRPVTLQSSLDFITKALGTMKVIQASFLRERYIYKYIHIQIHTYIDRYVDI